MTEIYVMIKRHGRLLSKSGYKLTRKFIRMSKKELIEEIIGSHSIDYLEEMGFIESDE